MFNQTFDSPVIRRTAIVGSGLAGLTAAIFENSPTTNALAHGKGGLVSRPSGRQVGPEGPGVVGLR